MQSWWSIVQGWKNSQVHWKTGFLDGGSDDGMGPWREILQWKIKSVNCKVIGETRVYQAYIELFLIRWRRWWWWYGAWNRAGHKSNLVPFEKNLYQMNECVEESTEWNKKNKLHFIQMRREKNVVYIALSIKNGWVFLRGCDG